MDASNAPSAGAARGAESDVIAADTDDARVAAIGASAAALEHALSYGRKQQQGAW